MWKFALLSVPTALSMAHLQEQCITSIALLQQKYSTYFRIKLSEKQGRNFEHSGERLENFNCGQIRIFCVPILLHCEN
jgi:hypothetical protein